MGKTKDNDSIDPEDTLVKIHSVKEETRMSEISKTLTSFFSHPSKGLKGVAYFSFHHPSEKVKDELKKNHVDASTIVFIDAATKLGIDDKMEGDRVY